MTEALRDLARWLYRQLEAEYDHLTSELLNEDLEMLEAIIENDDNLSYGAIVSVYTGDDKSITALTDCRVAVKSEIKKPMKSMTSLCH